MFSKEALRARDERAMGRMVSCARSWRHRIFVNLFAIVVCGFCLYLAASLASQQETGWVLPGVAALLVPVVAWGFGTVTWPLLREVARLRKDVEQLKAAARTGSAR